MSSKETRGKRRVASLGSGPTPSPCSSFADSDYEKSLLEKTLTSNEERAEQLKAFVERVYNATGVTPKFMPRKQGTGKKPAIRHRCRLDSDEARDLLVSSDEAIRQFREGEATGFYIYANRADHNTDGLFFVDQDNSTYFTDNLPDTLTIKSGSGGKSRHLPYLHDPEDRVHGSKAKTGDTTHGSIHAKNVGVMVPGSIHPSGGVYHIVEEREITTLSDSDLIEPMRPAAPTGDGTHRPDYSWSETTDPNPQIAQEGANFIQNRFSEEASDYATDNLQNALEGKEPDESRFRRDNEGDGWKEIDRSDLDYYTLSKIYGAFLYKFGTDKREMARKYAIETFKHYCQQHDFNDTGDRRKWLSLGDAYLETTMDSIESSFEIGIWYKWRRKTAPDSEQRPWHTDKNGIPSPKTQDVTNAVLTLLSTDSTFEEVLEMYRLNSEISYDDTPFAPIHTPSGVVWVASPSCDSPGDFTADRFSRLCYAINPDREISYYDRLLKDRLQKKLGKVKMAYCPSRENGKRYVYYSKRDENPDDATEITIYGKKYEPGDEELVDHEKFGSWAAKRKADIEDTERDEYELEESTPEIMTDGGFSETGDSEIRGYTPNERQEESTSMSQAELDPRANLPSNHEPDSQPSDEPAILVCPVEGCGSSFVGVVSLKNHVLHSKTPDHEWRKLNEDLELIGTWQGGWEQTRSLDEDTDGSERTETAMCPIEGCDVTHTSRYLLQHYRKSQDDSHTEQWITSNLTLYTHHSARKVDW